MSPNLFEIDSRRMFAFFRPRLLVLVLLIGSPVLMLSTVYWKSRTQRICVADWLPIDDPCEMISLGNSSNPGDDDLIVDLPVGPESPIQLLVSALAPSQLTVAATAAVEEISAEQVHFRPQPLPKREPDSPKIISGNTTVQISTLGTDLVDPKPAPHPDVRRPAHSREFWIHVTAEPLEDRRAYQRITGDLAFEHGNVQVFIDHDVSETADVQMRAAQIAKILDQEILPVLRGFLGPVRDVSGKGRLTVLMTPWLSRLQGGATQVKGFVRGTDFQPDLEHPFSNRGAILYLNTDLPHGTGLKTLLLHEATHAAIFSLAAGKLSDTPVPEDWINEGLAHLAERRLGGDWSNIDYRVARFYQQPETSPLEVRDYFRSDRWRDHGCRGASFLFLNEYARSSSSALPVLRNLLQRQWTILNEVEFERDRRNWIVSLARSTWYSDVPRKLGRFLNSGPRFHVWNVTERNDFALQTAGTATQFIELTSPRLGWFRLRIPKSSVDTSWQVTILKPPAGKPEVCVRARWNVVGQVESEKQQVPHSEPCDTRLIVSLSAALPAPWHWSDLACEATEGEQHLVRNWKINPSRAGTDSTEPVWLNPGRELALPLDFKPLQVKRVLKVRLQGPSGQTAWIWTDVPEPAITQGMIAATLDSNPREVTLKR
ncbi:MAG: hypothetical protein JWM11_3378 [Planctomycetaceae bacterium]|nr:hypothetical protein [Planctomycetaceae bacterium]